MSASLPHAGLPSALLTSPEFQLACQERDFGKIFMLCKRKAGVYPSRIAALCGMTPSRVGEVMSGRRTVAHINVIERVADGLRIPGAMLGLAQRAWEIPSGPLTETLSAQFGALPDQGVGDLEREYASDLNELLTLVDGKVTRSTLLALESSVQDYWRRDDEHGGASLRPAVVGHLRYVGEMMKGANGPLRRDLQALAAELARLAGWAYFDARQFSTARTHFTQALRLAHSQDDYLFMGNVMSCMSLQATYEGNYTDAVALACKAQDSARVAGDHPLVMSMLHMREAFAQAALRDPMACKQAIGRSRDAYERARGDEAAAPPWVRYFDETKLIVDTGIALARLGEYAKAEPLISEGLRRESVGRQRGRAFHAVWLATTQLQQGCLDAACDSASAALSLAASLDSPRVAGHVHEFHQRLLPYASESPVIAFEQEMREVLA